ncbi:amidohydrolase family protein [Streptomyces antimycoticus]|uniref:amidohydrolase family protein n=1 Tax=Streptomyces antimycoticus TaxID=68175 RepID=UPI000A36C2B5|nr:amidohydrolase family protein [Streptomyces antimycoticus]
MTNTPQTGGASAVRRSPTQEITIHTDTRDILANARRDTEKLKLDDYFIVDVDSHHVEQDSWPEIAEYLDSPVIRDSAREMMKNWPRASHVALFNNQPGLTMQDVSGRIKHQASLAEETPGTQSGSERDVVLLRRAMDAMSIDIQVVFPQPMLEIGLHPQPEIATALLQAYNRWFTTEVLPREPRIKTMLGLPFEDPQACLETIEEHAGKPGVIGFLVTSQRHAGVHQNAYMPVYKALEERGLPLGFHAGPNLADSMTGTMNKFLSAHAMSFVTCNMMHLTNWVINGIPERFPGLKTIWIESGLAWIPFMMQRLDHEYLMRQSDAPLLTKPPSHYMREMYYTTQPLEWTDTKLLKATFEAMDAPNTLMYSSDWPHWDFDVPGRIARLPFLDEQAKRNILGATAQKVFNL